MSGAGGDYVALSGAQLTFSPAEGSNEVINTSCITVTINRDDFVECDEDFILTISFPASQANNGALSIDNAQSTITINDSDSTRSILTNQS